MTFEDDPVEEDPIEEDPIEEDPPDEDEPSGFEGLNEAIAAGMVKPEPPLQRFLGKFKKS